MENFHKYQFLIKSQSVVSNGFTSIHRSCCVSEVLIFLLITTVKQFHLRLNPTGSFQFFNCFRYMNNYRLAGTHHCNGVVLGGRFSRSLINISLCINNCTVQNRLISLYETCVCLIIYLVPL